jgi:hypothetical protein
MMRIASTIVMSCRAIDPSPLSQVIAKVPSLTPP